MVEQPGADLVAYRKIGPFTERTLPQGLLKEHRLRERSWAKLTVLAGVIDFAWDDETRANESLRAGMSILIEPTVPHHLELTGAVELEIEFLRSSSTPESQPEGDAPSRL